MVDIPIFVISLKGSDDRFAAVERGLSVFGLTPFRVAAINGKRKAGLLKRMLRRNFYYKKHARAMTGGEIGCLASHMKILRKILKDDIAKSVILEDDVVFSDKFGDFYCIELSQFLDVADIVKIEGGTFSHTSRDGLSIMQGANCRAIVPLRPSLCSAGYAVTRKGAAALLKVAERVDEPFDFVLNSYERYRARYCELRPLLAWQSLSSSTIGEVGRGESGQPAKAGVSYAVQMRKAIGRFANAGSLLLSATRHSLRTKARLAVGNSSDTVQ